MERTLTWVHENPVLTGLGCGFLILVSLTLLLAILMRRAHTSLRPILWFVILFVIVAGPQAVVHVLDGLTLLRTRAAPPELPATTVPEPATQTTTAASDLQPVPWRQVLGPDAEVRAQVDPRFAWQDVLHDATEAVLTIRENGETALAARFRNAGQAARALQAYGTFNAFAEAEGSDACGWTALGHRNAGEWSHVLTAGAELYAWTGLSRETVLARRERALGPIAPSELPVTITWTPSADPLPSAPLDVAPLVPVEQSPRATRPELLRERLPRNPKAMVWFVGLNLVVGTLWFFKGSAWAARLAPAPVPLVAPAEALRRDLLALNHDPDLPTAVTAEPGGTISVEWRFADARWFDVMQVHHLKRAHRLVLIFDEEKQTVRVREYWSAFDASAGFDGLKFKWQKGTGIQFFHYEHTRVFGAQLDEHGRPTGQMSKAYTFNLQDLKRPLSDRVVEAGWTWQPVTWNLPESLRWLSE